MGTTPLAGKPVTHSKNKKGCMVIELDQGLVVQTGQTVQGRVKLRLVESFQASFLNLRFHGQERFGYRAGDGWLVKKQPVIENVQCIKRFDEFGGVIPPGEYQFPFQVLIPDTLQPSVLEFRDDHIMIRYWLKAVMEPQTNGKLWIEQRIVVQKPMPIIHTSPAVNFVKSSMIKPTGRQATPCKFSITVESGMTYKSGENIIINMLVDNSQCATKVKDYRLMLALREFNKVNEVERLEVKEIAWDKRKANCPAYGQQQVHMMVRIPFNGIGARDERQFVTESDLEILHSFTPSVSGMFFRLSYELHVEVRHDIFFEKGMNYKVLTEPIVVFAHALDSSMFNPITSQAAWELAQSGCCV